MCHRVSEFDHNVEVNRKLAEQKKLYGEYLEGTIRGQRLRQELTPQGRLVLQQNVDKNLSKYSGEIGKMYSKRRDHEYEYFHWYKLYYIGRIQINEIRNKMIQMGKLLSERYGGRKCRKCEEFRPKLTNGLFDKVCFECFFSTLDHPNTCRRENPRNLECPMVSEDWTKVENCPRWLSETSAIE